MSPHGQDPLRHAPNRRHGTIQSPGADATVPSNNVSIPSRHPRMPPHGQRIRRGIHRPPSHPTAGRKQHRVDRALRATATEPPAPDANGNKQSSPKNYCRPGANKRMLRVLELGEAKTRLLDLDRCTENVRMTTA